MRRFLILTAIVASASFIGLACGVDGDDGTGPPPPPDTYENIAGEYVGVLAGISEGTALDAELTLAISQHWGGIDGAYGLRGTLTDGGDVVSVWDDGRFFGSIDPGNDPFLKIRAFAVDGGCLNVDNELRGAYDSANRVITLSGTVPIIDDACQGYSSTMILYLEKDWAETSF